MKAFLTSIVVLLVVVIGMRFGLKQVWETSAASAFTTSNVRR